MFLILVSKLTYYLTISPNFRLETRSQGKKVWISHKNFRQKKIMHWARSEAIETNFNFKPYQNQCSFLNEMCITSDNWFHWCLKLNFSSYYLRRILIVVVHDSYFESENYSDSDVEHFSSCFDLGTIYRFHNKDLINKNLFQAQDICKPN